MRQHKNTIHERASNTRRWGYEFGCDGVVDVEEARRLLGGIGRSTLDIRVSDQLIRKGKDGKRAIYCRKSIADYLASIEI